MYQQVFLIISKDNYDTYVAKQTHAHSDNDVLHSGNSIMIEKHNFLNWGKLDTAETLPYIWGAISSAEISMLLTFINQ